MTYVAELRSAGLPQLYLWQPDAYKDKLTSLSLYKGIVIGVAGLLALFLTIVFVVKGAVIFPAAAALAWAVLAYVCIDFGFWNKLFGFEGEQADRVLACRRGDDSFAKATLLIFLFAYLNLNRWHVRASHVAMAWLAFLVALIGLAIFDAPIAAGVARISLATIAAVGFILVLYLSTHGYDRAVMPIPTWFLLLVWVGAAGFTVMGWLTNDLVSPALIGGLVLIVMLIGFTVDAERLGLAAVSRYGAINSDSWSAKPWRSPAAATRFSIGTSTPDRVYVSFEEVETQLGLYLIARNARGSPRPNGSTSCIHLSAIAIAPVSTPCWSKGAAASIRTSGCAPPTRIIYCGSCSRRAPVISVRTARSDPRHRHALRHHRKHDSGRHGSCTMRSVYDNLTGLPNRELFFDRLEAALARLALSPNPATRQIRPTVICIDIDRFKHINETIGFAAGDSILLTIARRLGRILKPQDTLARLSSDQFAAVVILPSSEPVP